MPKNKLKTRKFCSRKCKGKFMSTKQSWTYKGGFPKCLDCGKQLRTYTAKKCGSCAQKRKHHSPKSEFRKGLIPWNKNKHPKYMQGKNHPMFKGKKYDSNGYILIYMPKHPYAIQKCVRKHRLVIEQQIGRYLLPEEECHHLNRIKTDNRPQNLMAFTNKSAHKRFEWGGNVKPEEIIFDGRQIRNE